MLRCAGREVDELHKTAHRDQQRYKTCGARPKISGSSFETPPVTCDERGCRISQQVESDEECAVRS